MASQSTSENKVTEHARKDVASPATAALLGFLQNFAKKEEDYLDSIHGRAGKVLWGIGQAKLVPPCADEDEIPDESAQDKTAYLDMINGPGLQSVPSKPTVS
jgi:hypothetical protein